MKKYLLFLLALVICLPLFGAEEKRQKIEIAYEYSDYGYREPHMEYPIRDFGKKHGISLVYTRNSVLSDDVTESDPSFASIEFRYMTGKVDYDGYWSSGEPFYMTDVKDHYTELVLKLGRHYEWSSYFKLWPYSGIGYRGLRNGEDAYIDLGGGNYGFVYQRTSTYVYMPLGASLTYDLGESVRFTLNGQFDWLLKGNQNSHTGDMLINANSVSNKQHKGYGLRASLKLDVDFGKMGLFVEPFWRYWKIQNSEKEYFYYMDENGQVIIDPATNEPVVAGYMLEPFNITREYGLRAGITF